MLGGDSGSGEMAARQRQAEIERQRRVKEGIDLINARFRGGKAVTGAVAPNALSYGQTYYDASGNPVNLQDPGPSTTMVQRNRGSSGRSPDFYYEPVTHPSPKPSYAGQLFSGVEQTGGFDPTFFEGVEKDYTDYYTPLLNEQFTDARRRLLLGTPSSQSSAYLRNVGDLGTAYEREQVGVKERARARADATRGDVESTRLQLIQAAEGGSAPDLVAAQATERARMLQEPQPYEALGDLFARFAGQYANRQSAQRAGYDVGNPLTFGRSGGKSVTTVRN